jgi:hypothetical protein
MDLPFQKKPKNAWNAVLTQLLVWSFRRFCVHRLTTDEEELWDSHLDLLRTHTPKGFEPYLDLWTDPEHMANIPNLSELDAYFRALVKQLDEVVTEEEQDAISKILDEEMSPTLERWLGTVYAPFSLFPTPSESDEEINVTKLNAILYLLKSQTRHSIKTRRVTGRRSITPIKTHLKAKTRRTKQKNVQLQLSAGTCSSDAAGRSNESKESDSQQGKGGEGGYHEEERKDDEPKEGTNQEGNQEHQGAQLHAEPVHEPSAHKSELQKDS